MNYPISKSFELLNFYTEYVTPVWMIICVAVTVTLFFALTVLTVVMAKKNRVDAKTPFTLAAGMFFIMIVVLGALPETRSPKVRLQVQVTEDINVYEFMNEYTLLGREGTILLLEPNDQSYWEE